MWLKYTKLVALFSFILILQQTFALLQCRDENNNPVDWFTVYKVPKIKKTDGFFSKGLGYLYTTSKNYSNWTISQKSINASNSIIANTLKPFYSNLNTSYVIYNDQPPDEPSKTSKGHNKGVVLLDSESGLWLIHSVPHFPFKSNYSYPKTGVLKGQSFLCISSDLKNLNVIGRQLQYNEPQIYASFIHPKLVEKIGNLTKASRGFVVKQPPWYNSVVLRSQNGVQFQTFAKSKRFGKDLYTDWVAPSLGVDLLVETWLNGPGRLPSNCSMKYHVNNVKSLDLNGIAFASSEDHSKWATAPKWICIGDINRMAHQKTRGGGTVCLKNPILAQLYNNAIKSIEGCNNNSIF